MAVVTAVGGPGCSLDEDSAAELARVKWLIKSEPDEISIDDLAAKSGVESWDGIRNFEARNLLRSVKPGDLALFYHSSCKRPGIVGIVSFESEAYPERGCTEVDKRGEPRWYACDVKFVRKLKREIGLEELKQAAPLSEMVLIKRARLSVQPVRPNEAEYILSTSQ